MKCYDYDMGSYKLHIIPTDKFKTVNISINFKRIIKKEEITLRNFLNDILLSSNKDYKTIKEMEIKSEDLYNIRVYGNTSKSGRYGLISINGSFLNEKYTEKDMNNQSLSFIMDLLFNPNVSNNAFDKKSFEIVYNSLNEEIEEFIEEPRAYSEIRCLEEVDNTIPFSFRGCGYIEDLKKITPENLYEYYKSVIQSDLIDIFIIGEVDVEKIKELISSKFIVNTKKKESETHYIDFDSYRKRAKTIKESKDYNQSKLVLAAKVMNLSDFERQYALRLYTYILGGAPDSKLFQTVREKNSLCYYINCSPKMVSSLITISCGINKEDYKKCVKLIKKEMKNMLDGNITDEELVKAKIAYISSFKELYDNPFAVIRNYLSHVQIGTDLMEESIENIKKVTKEMIINVAHNIHLDTIYLLEGGNNNEEN